MPIVEGIYDPEILAHYYTAYPYKRESKTAISPAEVIYDHHIDSSVQCHTFVAKHTANEESF